MTSVTGYQNVTSKIAWSNAINNILHRWFNFNWSTLSGTGNMLAPENSVRPMCDLEGRPNIKQMTKFVLCNLKLLLEQTCCTSIPH